MSDKGDKSVFCADEATLASPPGSCRLRAGHQKGQVLIMSLEFSAVNVRHVPTRGEFL